MFVLLNEQRNYLYRIFEHIYNSLDKVFRMSGSSGSLVNRKLNNSVAQLPCCCFISAKQNLRTIY